MESKASDIDESLYSRQLYVMGHEAQRKMAVSSVLLVGLNGLGVEVAKNIILAGVKSVALHDSKAVSYEDLASQFNLSEADIGLNRAAVSAPKLAELNPYVNVSVLNEALNPTNLSQFTVVVLIDVPLSHQIEISDHCHANNIHVVIGDVRGVFGQIFCDFGKGFQVHDVNGEAVSSSMIAAITQDTKALVTVLEESRHNLETGDLVTFSEIGGMTELNGQIYKVTVKDPFSFEIDVNTTQFHAYERGGYANQVKQTVAVDFESFSNTLYNPGEIIIDFVKCEQATPLHIAFIALHKFQEQFGSLPAPGDMQQAQKLFDICVSVNQSLITSKLSESELEGQKNLIIRLALCSRGLVSPVCALLGGIMGQEVLKACSGKFMPIKQWYYYDAIEALTENVLSQDEVTPIGCRYDGQIIVFGKTLQQKLSTLNMFLVGAGAIGCEMIKNWAMMGIACDDAPLNGSANAKSGTVYVTDMDQIEKSNLSRQFLFRNTDINCPKSSTAVRAVKHMNNQFHGVSYESKVAPETESLFNDDFYEHLDMVCTALDNVEARLYIDQKCLFYHKPMLESGTLGAKGHTQVVVPFKTENYGATRDPPEKSIPVCTLKHFPNQIDHTLQWAREWFEEIYKQTPDDVVQYLTNPDYLSSLATQQNMKLETLTRVRDSIVNLKPNSIEDCIVWARHCFEDLFCNRIKQLLHNFPLDRYTASGQPFWSGAKKPPTVIEFDPSDPLHMEFIITTANMRAAVYQIAPTADSNNVLSAIQNIVLVPFRPADGVKIAATEEEAKAEAENRYAQQHTDIDVQCANVVAAIPPVASLSNFTIKSIDFDKDVDSHMRVVAAVSNLRARNYRIPEADLHVSRGIAGKITPAIATTTALVTGAICIELYKIIQDKPASKFVNSFTNLALPLFTSMEPEPPKATKSIIKGKEWKWTQWDRIDIFQPDMTVDELIEHLETEYGVELSMLSTGVTILYSDFMDRKKMKERKVMKLKDVVESVTKKTIPSSQKYMIFEIIVNDSETSEEVEIPYLRFRLF